MNTVQYIIVFAFSCLKSSVGSEKAYISRCVVHNPQLVLRAGGGTSSLTYSSCAMKTVRRTSSKSILHRPTTSTGTEGQIHVTIESLDPPVLRPGKRTCVVGTRAVMQLCKKQELGTYAHFHSSNLLYSKELKK